MSFATSQYRAAQTETASPVRVLVQLYDGALSFLREAEYAMDNGDIARKGVAIGKAHAIVSELMATLDPTRAPELCAELESLYNFVLHELTQANIQSDAARLAGPINVLQTLREAWSGIATGAAPMARAAG